MPFRATLTAESTSRDVAEQLRAGAQYLIEQRARPADQRGDDFATDVRSALDEIQTLDRIHDALVAAEEADRRHAAEQRNESRGGRSLGADLDHEARSMGDQVTVADGYDEWARTGRRGGPFTVEVRNLIGGFPSTHGNHSGADSALPVGSPVMVAGSMQRRRAFVRDLMSVQSTGLRVVPYFREKNQITNETGAQMVSEGSAKPEVTLEMEPYSAIVEKIAAWLPATEEILTDAPTLRGYIDTRLDYMLMIREEQQALNGNGTSPQLEGLETVVGTQTQALVTASGGDYSATIGRAISKVELVDGEPDGVVTNPADYWVAVTKRHSAQFDNGFGAGAPNGVGGITWGLPPVRTRAITAGSAWVGSWALGSTLFDRQQTTIKVGDQHSDNFIKNILVILGEKRIAVAWHRPNLFVKATVPTS